MTLSFDTVLIANRGEIALRIMRTAARLGLRTVAVYSDADADLPFVKSADEAVALGGSSPQDSYLCTTKILEAARRLGAGAIHPGYGFLSEDAGFARATQEAGLVWVGPDPECIRAMGNKVNARNIMRDAGVPVFAGSEAPVLDAADALRQARAIGLPVMVKAVGGGGGIGMTVVRELGAVVDAVDTARSRAERFFGDGAVFLERYVERARHIEVQIVGLPDGRVIALGERDCSVQRRHQKLAEETPSPAVDASLRDRLCASAVLAGEAVGYRGAGTVECLLDPATGEYSFLEMNTRLQVEHPVTEMVTGVDLVEEQFLVASGRSSLPRTFTGTSTGAALELRIYAEDPKRFLPSPGLIKRWVPPTGPGIRVDAGYEAGCEVSRFYDPLLAKLCIAGADRQEVLERAREAVARFEIEGPKVNLGFFEELLEEPNFVSGGYHTGIVDQMRSGSGRGVSR